MDEMRVRLSDTWALDYLVERARVDLRICRAPHAMNNHEAANVIRLAARMVLGLEDDADKLSREMIDLMLLIAAAEFPAFYVRNGLSPWN